MIRSTRGLKVVLGLCVLALGVFGASSAQASTWMVKGANLASGSKQVVGALDETGILHTKIGGNAVLFECTTGALENVFLESAGAVKGGDVKFSNCITKINGVTNAACTPNDSGTNPGVILSNPGKGKLALHSTGVGVTLIESTVEEVVAGVKQPVFGRVKSSAECPIGSNIPIIGPKIAIKDVTNGKDELEVEQLTHLIEQFEPLTEIWALSKTEEHKATILGKAKISLTSDEIWNGLKQ